MDPVRNPYAPGAGNPPPELAGRAGILEDAEIVFQRTAQGRPAQSMILVGLRGVGKTVLLNKLSDAAEAHAFRTHMIEAHEAKRLPQLLVPGLRTMLFRLSTVEGARAAANRALRVLKSFVNGVKFKYGDIEFSLGVDAETGAADSGDLEADLPALFVAVGEAARAALSPALIVIDEMQYLSEAEFSALIMAVHRTNQLGLPLLLLGAGLPQILGLAGESKSYAERLFTYPRIGALGAGDARDAIVTPAAKEGVQIEPEAVAEIVRITEGYPYFIQQWAFDAWNHATGDVIKRRDVEAATRTSIRSLDENFFRVRFDRCTPSEKRYMRALAEFGPGAHRSGDIAEMLGLKTTSVGPTRGKLIRKGMIYSPQHGDTAFTVPLFDAYMRRAMPELER
ncbi:MAG: AAA family ATPase [Pikeienuella sp.]|uniref:AAA family ATPase n=1 Tax=Pikeienuella sp. TaxID=2831957 RepID=UPI0039196C9F